MRAKVEVRVSLKEVYILTLDKILVKRLLTQVCEGGKIRENDLQSFVFRNYPAANLVIRDYGAKLEP